jgi:hypothetical protein
MGDSHHTLRLSLQTKNHKSEADFYCTLAFSGRDSFLYAREINAKRTLSALSIKKRKIYYPIIALAPQDILN